MAYTKANRESKSGSKEKRDEDDPNRSSVDCLRCRDGNGTIDSERCNNAGLDRN
ncbi:MAG: hypothetical protein ABSH32_00640 [Bryobacteraceae bacterium]